MKGLGDRMKRYELNHDFSLTARLPVIIRLDGKGFSKWTKSNKMKKPYDLALSTAMHESLKFTCSRIEGCMIGFTQSDEATIVLRNDQSLESEPWFGNRVQKIVSVTSSMFTAKFNEFCYANGWSPAFFDARVFALPTIDEAINCLVWRQNDAVKNSIYGACYYELANVTGKKTAQKLMHGKSQDEQQELLFSKTGRNWNTYPTWYKRGVAVYKIGQEFSDNNSVYYRSSWEADLETPRFTQNRGFLKNILEVEDVRQKSQTQ